MCMFATVLFTLLSILPGKQGHAHPAVLSRQCHRLQERVRLCDRPGAPTGIDDKRCAIDMAIICGCLKRMGVTPRWDQRA